MTNNEVAANQEQEHSSNDNGEIKLYSFSDFSYDTGFADGALRLRDVSHYETFSANLEKKELAINLLERCRRELAKLTAELELMKCRTLELYSTIFEREEKINITGVRLKEAFQKRDEQKEVLQKVEDACQLVNSENSRFPAIMLLVSGFSFILADVLITEEIMEEVLSMSKFEAWTIAISLSLTVFGVKPIIDRIFERPRWENNKILRNNVFLVLTGLLIMSMLALLGYLRVKGYEIMISGLSSKEWANIFKNQALFGIFILASILFAVVGALCLSIGFRSSEQNSARRSLSSRIKQLMQQLSLQETVILELQEGEARWRQELRQAQKELEIQPLKTTLEMRIAGLGLEEKDLMGLIAEANSAAQAAWYRAGIARGESFNVSGELYVSPIRMERWVVPESIQGSYQIRIKGRNGESQSKSVDTRKEPITRTGDYLYQQIRSAIALHDNRAQKKSSFNNGK